MLTHPTLDQMHQLGLAGMARAFAELEANPQSADLARRMAWLAARSRSHRSLRAAIAGEAALCPAAAPGCGRGRRLPSPSRPRPRTVSGADRRALDRRGAEPGRRRAGRCRQELAGLRPRTKGLPRQSLGALSAHSPHVRRSRARPWRRAIPAADAGARRRQTADPRRLGARASARAATRRASRSSKTAMAAAPP